ncbi:MAG: glucuronate isomerase [Bacteroidales bacterium]
MKPFLDSNFLLTNTTAERLYFGYAAKMPVIDYHSHLNPRMIAENHQFENITQAWLYGDHYKWRAMRANGIPDQFITGDATDYEKFEKWAETVPYTLGNPLYHWTHLELQRYFGITSHLSLVTCHSIYESASGMLHQPDFSVRSLLEKMNVEVVCTTDDPLDSLDYHRQIAESGWKVKVLPTWRPDKILALDQPESWNRYVDTLSEITGISINHYNDLLDALRIRHDYFHNHGCRLSDHGLETFPSRNFTQSEIESIFQSLRQPETCNLQQSQQSQPLQPTTDSRQLTTALLLFLSRLDADQGWVQQFHLGALRSANSRGLRELGPDSGFDSISDLSVAKPMARFLDQLESEGKLAKTILYNLNPAYNEVLASMTGNFQDGSVPGKIQWGSAWWFLDQKDGMEAQIKTLANFGLLSRFIGMLTDSRSFLSYPRHEYFRRILCNFIGESVERGEWPEDQAWLGALVESICYGNAKNYFNF